MTVIWERNPARDFSAEKDGVSVHQESGRKLAVLIVAYRAADKLARCLRSVHKYLPQNEIHVWDNSGESYDGVRNLARLHPEVHWNFSNQNIGFAAAVNKLAAAVADCDMLLLNPDAELVNSLDATKLALASGLTAAAGPMTTSEHHAEKAISPLRRTHAPWDVAHRRQTALNAIGCAAGLAERLRGTRLSNLYRTQPTEVSGYLTGACLAISRAAWNSVGPFDEEFFLYGEEEDWQMRARSAGWILQLANEVGVRHEAMGTVAGHNAGLSRSLDLLLASTALSIELRAGRRTADLYLVWWMILDFLKGTIGRGSRPLVDGSQFLMTLDGPRNTLEERINTALELNRLGKTVTIMSLQRLGAIPMDVPTSIRLVRGVWWWPAVPRQRVAPILITGETRRERGFARLYRTRSGRKLVSPNQAVASAHQNVS